MRLERRLVEQELDRDRLAIGQHALAVLDHQAGVLQQRAGFAQQRAVLTRAVRDRRHERLAEYLVGDLAAEWLEQGELLRAGLANRHQRRILEYRMGPLVGPVHDGLVRPFEIEGVGERLAQALVLELGAPSIEEPALRAGRRIVGDDVALDATVADRREVITRGPEPRGELLLEQEALAGETFEG